MRDDLCRPVFEDLEPRLLLSVTVFSEDFEGVFPGAWVRNTSQSRMWDDTNYKANTGNWSAHCAENLDETSTNTYVNNMDTYMERTVDLSAYGVATLSFAYWMNTEPPYRDRLDLKVNGTRFWTQGGDWQNWGSLGLNLNAYAGLSSVTIRFEFISDGSVVPAGDAGVWLDDIELTAGPDPDDQISEAIDLGTIPPTTPGYGYDVYPGTDVEMFTFNVAAGDTIAFDIDTGGGAFALGDSYIRLFDASGTQLAYNDDGTAPGESVGVDSYLEYTFGVGGTYYLGVSGYANNTYDPLTGAGDVLGSTGEYTITVSKAWPQAPFSVPDVYVNQDGRASFGGSIGAIGEIDTFGIFFDDAGPIDVQGVGSTYLDLALYGASGPPVSVYEDHLIDSVSAQSRHYLGARSHTDAFTGSYGLEMDGPAASVQHINVTGPSLTGSDTDSISGTYDYDFFSFTTKAAGDWTVTAAVPSGSTDLTMVVYNSAGEPVGGSFLTPINDNGAGGAETWTGVSLAKGETYYVRVDGHDTSTGTYYGVGVDGPDFAVCDFNYDGKVDGGDLAIWQQNYDPLGNPSNSYEMGDANGDGKIDGGDLALWQQNYDPIGPTGGSAAPLVSWPNAPLPGATTLYVNQNGKATLSRTLGAVNEIDAYEVFFERSGNMVAQTTGTTDTEMAFYDGWGAPDLTDDNSGAGLNARIDAGVLKWDRYSLAVAGYNGTATGPYGLSVGGPVPAVEVVPVSVYNLGHATSSVDDEHDFEFFRFTTTVGGDWTVHVSTDSGLDPMLVVYDSAGSPVGGSFTNAIDYTGAGGSESWVGTVLAKNATYYVRVDGFAGSTGNFRLDITGPRVPVIPRQTWSTYVGGTDFDYTGAVATDGNSSVIVAGKTQSSGWTVGGFDTTYGGALDAFVVKIGPNGQHVWSTYVGDTGADAARAVAVDSADNIYVVGETFSSGWVSGGWITTYGGGADGFVLKLSPAGVPLWSSYLGGSNWEAAYGVTVDGDDNVIITGYTQSSGWVSDGWDDGYNGAIDGFAVKLSSSGTHMWSTYLGGANDDSGNAVTTDATGAVLVAGETASSGWVGGGYDTTLGGTFPETDGFIVKLASNGAHVWSTYVGGSTWDKAYGIDADPDGNALVALWTRSSGWVSRGYDTSYGGLDDGALVKVSATGGHLWSTYVGGAAYDEAAGAAMDRFGNAVGVGGTETSGWPSGGFDTTINGSRDPWVVHLRPDGTHGWSSYLGGSSFDGAFGVAVDGHSEIAIGGDTSSALWTSGGYDITFNGFKDVYVFKIRVTRAVEGDANGDGKVDGADLAIWQANYDPTGSDPNNDWGSADFNGDGKVDGGDLALWQQNYDPVGSSGSGAVPLSTAVGVGQTGMSVLLYDGAAAPPGDASGDGVVEGDDLAIWQQHYDPVGGDRGSDFGDGDFDRDARIDGADLAILQQHDDALAGAPMSMPITSTWTPHDRGSGQARPADVSEDDLIDILTLAALQLPLGV